MSGALIKTFNACLLHANEKPSTEDGQIRRISDCREEKARGFVRVDSDPDNLDDADKKDTVKDDGHQSGESSRGHSEHTQHNILLGPRSRPLLAGDL